MKIIAPKDFHTKLSNKHLLLDTSFFIDVAKYAIKFQEIIDQLKSDGNTLVTIEPVRAEFLLGSEEKNRITKNEMLEDIIDLILPITPDVINKQLNNLVNAYGPKGRGIGMCDLLIGATLQKYSNDLFLVTKNPKDFPKPTTQLITYFLLDLNQGLHTYAILSKTK